MANSIEAILNYLNLSSSVETVKAGVPKVLPEAFWTMTERVIGDKANYIKYTGTRQVARVSPYGAPPVQTKKVDVSDQNIKLLHTEEKMPFSQELYRVFRDWENYKPQQMFARQQIVYQGEQFAQRFDNLRVASVTQMLALGLLYFDVNGNLLPTSSGADLTIDYGVPANNKNQLNGLISASWATTSTNIVNQINNIKMTAVQTTGHPLKYAFYGKNIAGYITNNTSMQYYLARNAQLNEKFISTGTIPPGVLDLIWVPVQNAFFEDQNGTVQEIFGADTVTFFPEITKNIYTLFEGSMLVPSSFGMFADAMAALSSLTEMYGRFRYAYLDVPPTQIFDVAGDTFLPMLRNPSSIFIADVTP